MFPTRLKFLRVFWFYLCRSWTLSCSHPHLLSLNSYLLLFTLRICCLLNATCRPGQWLLYLHPSTPPPIATTTRVAQSMGRDCCPLVCIGQFANVLRTGLCDRFDRCFPGRFIGVGIRLDPLSGPLAGRLYSWRCC